jgi:hypothetical protein
LSGNYNSSSLSDRILIVLCESWKKSPADLAGEKRSGEIIICTYSSSRCRQSGCPLFSIVSAVRNKERRFCRHRMMLGRLPSTPRASRTTSRLRQWSASASPVAITIRSRQKKPTSPEHKGPARFQPTAPNIAIHSRGNIPISGMLPSTTEPDHPRSELLSSRD